MRVKQLLRDLNEVVYSRMHSLLHAFQQMDADGDKTVTVDEFVKLLRTHDVNISHEEAWSLFRLVTDDDLTYSTFVKLLALNES